MNGDQETIDAIPEQLVAELASIIHGHASLIDSLTTHRPIVFWPEKSEAYRERVRRVARDAVVWVQRDSEWQEEP